MLRLLVLYIIVMLGVKLGASTNQNKPAMITFDQTDHQQQVSISQEDTFQVVLPVQMGTGYSWQWEEQEAFNLLGKKVENQSYQPGSQEQQVFLIQSLRKGTNELRLSYRRPWEKQVLKTFELQIKVSE